MAEPDDAPALDPAHADKFTLSAMGTVMTQCVYCVHQREGFMPTCDAFPDAVPQAILSNELDHRDPIEGDRGIRFEPRPDVREAILKQLYAVLDKLPS